MSKYIVDRRILWLAVTLSAPVLVAALGTGVRLWWIPQWALDGNVSTRQAVLDYRTASTPAFAALVQATGGIFLAFGAWVALRQLRASDAAQREERWSRAVDMVASDREELRILGVSALERLGSHVSDDRQQTVDLLAGMVRARSKERGTDSKTLPRDALAGILAISRLNAAANGRLRIDLTGADLSYGVLSKVDLRSAFFSRTNMRHTVLDDAQLNGADFSRADWSYGRALSAQLDGAKADSLIAVGCNFSNAFFIRSNFNSCDFREASFDRARLENHLTAGGDFRNASFQSAKFIATGFTHSDLRGADLNIDTESGPFLYIMMGPVVVDATTKIPRDAEKFRPQSADSFIGRCGPKQEPD